MWSIREMSRTPELFMDISSMQTLPQAHKQ